MTDTIATTAGCSRVSHSPSRSLSLPLGSSILLSLSPYSPFSINVSLFIVWSLSLCPAKTVSQQQSSEIPRTRYEFTFLLLYSTLACPPFCLLESLVCLADLRLPYVSAARLSHRLLFSPFFPVSFSLSSDLLPLYTRMIVLFRRRRSRLRRLFRCLRRRCHRRLVVVKLSWSRTCLRAAPYDRRVYTYYE